MTGFFLCRSEEGAPASLLIGLFMDQLQETILVIVGPLIDRPHIVRSNSETTLCAPHWLIRRHSTSLVYTDFVCGCFYVKRGRPIHIRVICVICGSVFDIQFGGVQHRSIVIVCSPGHQCLEVFLHAAFENVLAIRNDFDGLPEIERVW